MWPYNTAMTHLSTTSLEPPYDINLGILGMGAIGSLMAFHFHQVCRCFRLSQDPHRDTQFSLADSSKQYRLDIPHWNTEALDVLIVCVKAHQTELALQQWRRAIGPATQIILLQNGMGQHQIVAQLFPNNTIFAASSTEGANRQSADLINYAGQGLTHWGYYSGPKAQLKLPIDKAQGQHLVCDNIEDVLINKLIVNAVINPLTVKFQCRNGQLLEIPEALHWLKELCNEVETILQSTHFQGVREMTPGDVYKRVKDICTKTAKNISSMRQDIIASRTTEIDYINGYLVNLAKSNSIRSPLNDQLIDHVKNAE